MQPGEEQRFIGVDVTQPSQEGLVQEQWFQLPLALRQPGMELLHRNCRIQRLGAKFLQDGLRIGNQPDPPEFARIVKKQRAFFIKVDG